MDASLIIAQGSQGLILIIESDHKTETGYSLSLHPRPKGRGFQL
jgi:hypothetical protein